MKYIRQFLIILLFCFLGELLKYLIPLPIPTSIYGLILMLTALLSGILKVDQVDDTAVFLIDIMPVMFIPAGVGLLTSIEALRPNLAAIIVITILTTILVMAVTGITAQLVMERKSGRLRTGNIFEKEDWSRHHEPSDGIHSLRYQLPAFVPCRLQHI